MESDKCLDLKEFLSIIYLYMHRKEDQTQVQRKWCAWRIRGSLVMRKLRKGEDKRRGLSNCIMSPLLYPVLKSSSAVTIYFVPMNLPEGSSGFSSPGPGYNDAEGHLKEFLLVMIKDTHLFPQFCLFFFSPQLFLLHEKCKHTLCSRCWWDSLHY